MRLGRSTTGTAPRGEAARAAVGPGSRTGADAQLVISGLRHRYLGRVTALDGVDLTIGRGESVALLGANGCGKSTLLRVMDGLLFPDEGSYTAFGERVTEEALEDEARNRAFRSRVGFVFQSTDVQLFSTTVRDELAFGCRQLGLDEDETRERVADVLALLDIESLADRPPYQLSGGQAKRVAIASVLVMAPRVLLLDEPTAALDPRSQAAMVALVRTLNEAGTTIVIASHDLDVVESLAARSVVLTEDHIVARDAPTADVLADTALLRDANLIA